jgi:hypothetical protein
LRSRQQGAKIYDWVNDNGRLYIDDWIEEVERKAG